MSTIPKPQHGSENSSEPDTSAKVAREIREIIASEMTHAAVKRTEIAELETRVSRSLSSV
jgi:hypothetical protein